MGGETWVALISVLGVIATALVNLLINRNRNETREVRFENLTAALVQSRFPNGGEWDNIAALMNTVGVDNKRDQRFIALLAGYEPPLQGTLWQRQ
jgi:hypothetical protein